MRSCCPSWLWSLSCCPWQCWIQRAFLGSNVFQYWQTRSETNTWSTRVNRINLLKSQNWLLPRIGRHHGASCRGCWYRPASLPINCCSFHTCHLCKYCIFIHPTTQNLNKPGLRCNSCSGTGSILLPLWDPQHGPPISCPCCHWWSQHIGRSPLVRASPHWPSETALLTGLYGAKQIGLLVLNSAETSKIWGGCNINCGTIFQTETRTWESKCSNDTARMRKRTLAGLMGQNMTCIGPQVD